MPNISASVSQERIEDLEYLIEKSNLFLQLHDIPLEVTRSSVIADLIMKEAKRIRDIHNDTKGEQDE